MENISLPLKLHAFLCNQCLKLLLLGLALLGDGLQQVPCTNGLKKAQTDRQIGAGFNLCYTLWVEIYPVCSVFTCDLVIV